MRHCHVLEPLRVRVVKSDTKCNWRRRPQTWRHVYVFLCVSLLLSDCNICERIHLGNLFLEKCTFLGMSISHFFTASSHFCETCDFFMLDTGIPNGCINQGSCFFVLRFPHSSFAPPPSGRYITLDYLFGLIPCF